jgi:pantoate--beta-alanine ligase
MNILKDIQGMKAAMQKWRERGHGIALVPTMGYFHEGHLALMKRAGELADKVVVSIFVNPAQFGPGEDLDKYPRDVERDMRLAEGVGVDAIFIPRSEAMYPENFSTWVTVEGLSENLCGSSRPGHFRGVATVVAKLFNLVEPHFAVFGEKDFQQLAIIRQMTRDLNISVNIVSHPTVREKDGLAMSSRNAYLSPGERKVATCLFRSLKLAEEMIRKGETNVPVIKEAISKLIMDEKGTKIDYIFMGDPEKLIPYKKTKSPTLLALAVWVGKTRLIDNKVIK